MGSCLQIAHSAVFLKGQSRAGPQAGAVRTARRPAPGRPGLGWEAGAPAPKQPTMRFPKRFLRTGPQVGAIRAARRPAPDSSRVWGGALPQPNLPQCDFSKVFPVQAATSVQPALLDDPPQAAPGWGLEGAPAPEPPGTLTARKSISQKSVSYRPPSRCNPHRKTTRPRPRPGCGRGRQPLNRPQFDFSKVFLTHAKSL